MEATVKTWMSGDPVSIAPDASALEAFELMVERGIRHLPVLASDPRRKPRSGGSPQVLVGVLSIDDLRAALPFEISLQHGMAPANRERAREWRVGEIMTHAPETVGPDASLGEAAERMAERRIGCLPVVDESGHLAGLLSETDVLWAFATSLRGRPQVGRARAGELAALVAELERERERIRARLAQRMADEQELTAVAREEPLDEAERGADWTDVRTAATLDDLAVRRLAAIDHALDRAAEGALGRCVDCGGVIPIPRLRALPGTTACVACAARHARA